MTLFGAMEYRAEFTATLDDALLAHRIHNRKSEAEERTLLLLAPVSIVAFAVVAFGVDLPVIAVFGLIPAVVFLMPTWMNWDFRRRIAKLPEAKLSITLNEEGVHIRGSDPSNVWETHQSWSQFKKVSLDQRGALLYTESPSYLFIPARAFSPRFSRTELGSFIRQMFKGPNQSSQPTRLAPHG